MAIKVKTLLNYYFCSCRFLVKVSVSKFELREKELSELGVGCSSHLFTFLHGRRIGRGEGGGISAVERATPGEEVPGSISAVAARSLLVGSVSV